jgi:sensor histidine kinase YesM
MAACYVVLEFFFPRYLLKGKYLSVILYTLILAAAMTGLSYLLHQVMFPLGETKIIPFAKGVNSNNWWASIFAGPLSAMKIILAALAIKLVKRWWLKQKESQQLEREKINAELQLLKAQIHPGFLFNTLNNVYVYSMAGSPRASEMLLKLSDLLSYMLYECDRPLVPLVKEIQIMKEYMALEKIRLNDNLDMEVNIKGDPNNKLIAPFLLLPFIENSFKHCNAMTEKCWISLEIKVEENAYLIKLINGISPDFNRHPDHYGNGLVNVQKRLALLYPDRHQLKMNAEEEVFLVNLRIQLNEGSEERTVSNGAEIFVSAEPVLADRV